MIRGGCVARTVSVMNRLPLVCATCVATLVAVPISNLDAAGERCGPEVIDDWADLQAAVEEFANGRTCSLISLDGDVVVEGPVDLLAIDEFDQVQPIGRSLTIEGNGHELSGNRVTSGLSVFLSDSAETATLIVRNLHLNEFGGSGALTVAAEATVIERSHFTDNSRTASSPIPESAVSSAGALNVFGRPPIVGSPF